MGASTRLKLSGAATNLKGRQSRKTNSSLKVDADGVFAREACRTVANFLDFGTVDIFANGGLETLDRQVNETFGSDLFRQLVRIEFVGNQFVRCWNVDAHVARVVQRRRRNSDMNLEQRQKSVLVRMTSIHAVRDVVRF